ncbi:MAG: hypothetical protein ACLVJH_02220 [Faecalibacterium prausnitzii]
MLKAEVDLPEGRGRQGRSSSAVRRSVVRRTASTRRRQRWSRKTEALERRKRGAEKRAAEAEASGEIDALRAKEMERLETLAEPEPEDAREVLLHKVDEELTHERPCALPPTRPT